MVTANRMCMAAPLCGGGGPEDLPLPAVHERRHLGRGRLVSSAPDLFHLPMQHFYGVEGLLHLIASAQEQYHGLFRRNLSDISAYTMPKYMTLINDLVQDAG